MSLHELPLPTLLQAPLRSRPSDIKEKSAGDTSPLLRQTGHCSLPTQVTFVWNNQKCYGSQFHLDVLAGDWEVVDQQHSRGASVTEEFHYRSSHSQSLTHGQPIHLAASRGHVQVVELLLVYGASLESTLHRDGKTLYNVLDAAVYGEGFGGQPRMIDFLCQRKADIMSVNHQNWTLLHVAFQTGNLETIECVQNAVLQRPTSFLGVLGFQNVDFHTDQRMPTPLEIGIKCCKMNTRDLAESAEPSMLSFRTFIHRAPECIPSFAERLQELWSEHELTQRLGSVTVEDLATLLNDFPQAAASVLEAATARPFVVSEGRHPLPARVSFACREYTVLHTVRKQMPCLCFYTREVEWIFNDSCRMAPEWHSSLTDVRDRPMHDAKIQVCHIPDIISPVFFSAVLDARTTHQEALFLFKCTPVRGAIWFTFWNGSMWVDVVQTATSTWGLCLLVIESFMARQASVETDQAFVALKPSLANGEGIVADWIVAKGIVDVLLEAVLFAACCRQDPTSYCRLKKNWDLIRSFLPIMLLWQYESRLLQCLIILMYWMRLLEGVSLSKL
eukprot:s1268_g1.t1